MGTRIEQRVASDLSNLHGHLQRIEKKLDGCQTALRVRLLIVVAAVMGSSLTAGVAIGWILGRSW